MLFVVRCRCDLLIISIKQVHMVRKKEKWYLPSPAQNSVGIILMQRRGDTEGTSVCLGSFKELLVEARATSAHTRVQCHRTAPEPTLHQAPRTEANSTSSLNKAAETRAPVRHGTFLSSSGSHSKDLVSFSLVANFSCIIINLRLSVSSL